MITFLAAIGTILGAVYAIWLYNRLMFGQIRLNSLYLFIDINRREFLLLLPLVFLIFLMGIYPTLFFKVITLAANNYINLY
jgi:NADH:ubiquinone oxidoreductase subunit 4 (subunit M)